MGNISPVKLRIYRKFLKKMECSFYSNKGDHEIWGKNNLNRPITFQTKSKEVPPFIIRSNNKTLGIDDNRFLDIISKL